MTNELTSLPNFNAGSTVSYRRSLADYPADDGWVLTLYLAGGSVVNAAAVADGADHVVTISATQTSGLAPGVYRYLERVVKGDDKRDVGVGSIEVGRDLATAGPGDAQTWEEKTLAVLEAKFTGRLTADIEEYQIGGRAVKHIPIEDLRALRNELTATVARQKSPGRISRPVLARFTGTGFNS